MSDERRVRYGVQLMSAPTARPSGSARADDTGAALLAAAHDLLSGLVAPP